LRAEGIGTIVLGEEELAHGMLRHVLDRFAPAAAPGGAG
jgi:hypothetical protein